jgi:hypothetical protein
MYVDFLPRCVLQQLVSNSCRASDSEVKAWESVDDLSAARQRSYTYKKLDEGDNGNCEMGNYEPFFLQPCLSLQ